MAIKLIIGLQNPGTAYEKTRHNAGGWLVCALAKAHQLSFKIEKKFEAQWTELETNQQRCHLVLPLTFMNHCGRPTRSISQFYKILPEELLVIHDELDLPVGRIKLKTGGGHGGHNGLRDIIAQIGSEAFHRLRIGIGHPGHKNLVHDYVLSTPSVHDKQCIIKAIDKSIDLMPLIVAGDISKAMNQLHT